MLNHRIRFIPGSLVRARRLLCSLVAGALLLLAPRLASAHDAPGGNLGFGLGVGAPSGLSLEVGAGPWSSVELALGLDAFESSGGYGHLVFKGDLAELAAGPTVRVPLYLGGGVYIYDHDRAFNDNAEVGIRVPLGIDFDFQRSPLQLFAEIALGIPLRNPGNADYARDPWVAGYAGFRIWF